MTGIKYLMISMGTLFLSLVLMGSEVKAGEAKDDRIKLPAPRYESKTSLEKALRERRSVREFKKETLTLSEIAQLLWSAQGITASGGLRTAPSAGALYPLEVYIIVGNVTNMKSGIYKYIPESHELVKVIEGDKRSEMSKAALHQSPITDAPAVIVFSAVYERTSGKYGERGIRYVQMEAGHAAQNILLQAVSLNLGAVVMGAFEDDKVERAMDMKPDEKLLYVIPVGRCKIP
jgi:SagB-type dehydrogenase family enzyme